MVFSGYLKVSTQIKTLSLNSHYKLLFILCQKLEIKVKTYIVCIGRYMHNKKYSIFKFSRLQFQPLAAQYVSFWFGYQWFPHL